MWKEMSVLPGFHDEDTNDFRDYLISVRSFILDNFNSHLLPRLVAGRSVHLPKSP